MILIKMSLSLMAWFSFPIWGKWIHEIQGHKAKMESQPIVKLIYDPKYGAFWWCIDNIEWNFTIGDKLAFWLCIGGGQRLNPPLPPVGHHNSSSEPLHADILLITARCTQI